MTTLLARHEDASKDAVTQLSQAPTLPRMGAAMARAASRLYSACGPLALPVRDATWSLQWRASPHALQWQESFGFRLGPHAGWVDIDALALGPLLDESRAHLLPRELRCVLWADALHGVAQALERLTRLRFEWTLPEGEAPAVQPLQAIAFELHSHQGARFCGFVQLDDANALDAIVSSLTLPRPPAAQGLNGLRIPLPFSLGSTQITLREVAGIRAGDIVSIETWASSGAGLLVTAELGAGRRLVGLAEGSRITLQQIKDTAMNRDSTPDPTTLLEDGSAAPLPLDRLDALEVNLRFEVGELSLSLGELKSIRAGHVFDLGQPLNKCAVRILAHGNVLGKGHLVAVGERLGVRVSEFAPSEI
ncbi:MAG TPA: type III secretion system cytoplasmic ring protein SctQ [Rhizobacter sp.]|nr:type III secretion system cytoplasmic ring protein SctQ [Rhizobacter sp.]